MIIRQATARAILVGPVLDAAGAAKTDEVVGSIKVTKNGTVGSVDGAATLTHDHAGKYRLALTASDTDTVGILEISLNSGTNDMPVKGLNVVEQPIWDALFANGATGLLPANITQISGDAQSATDLKDFVDAGYDPATNRLTGTVELDSAATAALVDLIWDEPLTGATHNVATSSGKRLRQATAFQQIDSTVIDASATTTTFVTGLDSAVDNFYNDSMLVFTDGALAGQVRSIVDYVGATKTIVLEEPLTSAPVNGVAFTIVSLHIHPVSQIQSGLATQASVDTIDNLLDTEMAALTAAVANIQVTVNSIASVSTEAF
jgi:hypothetical protein